MGTYGTTCPGRETGKEAPTTLFTVEVDMFSEFKKKKNSEHVVARYLWEHCGRILEVGPILKKINFFVTLLILFTYKAGSTGRNPGCINVVAEMNQLEIWRKGADQRQRMKRSQL